MSFMNFITFAIMNGTADQVTDYKICTLCVVITCMITLYRHFRGKLVVGVSWLRVK